MNITTKLNTPIQKFLIYFLIYIHNMLFINILMGGYNIHPINTPYKYFLMSI